MKFYFLAIILVVITGCFRQGNSDKEKPLARVHDQFLYPSDLDLVFPPDISSEDSIRVVKDYVEKWVHNQLLLNKAEQNLTPEEKDVDMQIEDYRTSLLIYAYQQSYLRQKLDTLVNMAEVEEFYKQNNSNFILSETMLKCLVIKVPVAAPEIWKVRQWYMSSDPENIRKLEEYCFSNAEIFDDFDEQWVKMYDVLKLLPQSEMDHSSSLLNRRSLETHDDQFHYFIYAREVAPEGTVSPFELVQAEIQHIILNKRKITLINELEQRIFQDAQNREHFTIYP